MGLKSRSRRRRRILRESLIGRLRVAAFEAHEGHLKARIGLNALYEACVELARGWGERAIPVPDGLENRVLGEALGGLIDARDAIAVLEGHHAAALLAWIRVPLDDWPPDVHGFTLGVLRRCWDGAELRPSGALEQLEDIRRRQGAARRARSAIERLIAGQDEAALDELRGAALALGAEARGDVWRSVEALVEEREVARASSSRR